MPVQLRHTDCIKAGYFADHVNSMLVCYAPDGQNTMDDVWMDPEVDKGQSFLTLFCVNQPKVAYNYQQRT